MLRFIDGFDHYSVQSDIGLKWSAWNAMFIYPVNGRFGGTGAIQVQGGQNCYVRKIFDNQPTWIAGGAFKISTSISPGNIHHFMRFTDAGSSQLELRLDGTSHKLTLHRNGTLLGTGTTVLGIGAYYYIELKATIASSISAGSCVVALGGVPEITLAAGTNTQATGNASADTVEFGAATGNSGNSEMFLDDVYICDGTGSTNNNLLGDVRVETLYPTGAGSNSGFTPTSGANYTCVNEAHEDGDSSYVASATIGTKDSYLFGSLATTPSTVFGVQMDTIARKDDAGGRTVSSIFHISGTDYAGSPKALFDSYTFLNDIHETNPATSTPWTGSTINALEAGVKLVS